MNKQVLVLIIVIAMVLLIGIQTYEISALKNNIGNGLITNSNSAQSNENNYNSQGNTQPTMVGGC